MSNLAAARLAASPTTLLQPVLVLVAAALLGGCSRQVVVDGSFSEGVPRTGDFSNVLVVGVSPDPNVRCAFEQALASDLRSGAVKATMSCMVMNTKEPLTRESVEHAVASIGADAVLATSLVGSSAKAESGGSADSRGGGYYKPIGYGYDAGYWGYYGVPTVYGEFEVAPPVFSISGAVELSTRLFETRDATLIYTLVVKAKNLDSRENAIAEIAPAIANKFVQEGLIR